MSQPKLEYASHPQAPFATKYHEPGKRFSRVKVFIISFLLCLSFGLLINYSRPPVYQSHATLLVSAMTAIDQRSAEFDLQNVAIQKQKLLSADLLTQTLEKVHADSSEPKLATLTLADIRNMLTVEPIAETNLVSMQAQGDNAEILPLVINSWIDVYIEARALNIKNSTADTIEMVQNELTELDRKINQTRLELDEFRKTHDISSIVREENEAPAKLLSLTTALNNANEELVKSKAKLDAINQSIAQGEAVVPSQEQDTLTNMEKRLQELKEKLAEFDKHYTRDYLVFKGSLKYLPEQIKKLEAEITAKKQSGKQIVRTEANQEYAAAKQVVEKIRQQLDEHKVKASNFTSLFSQHQRLVDDLESLETINRETQDRLVNIESKQFDKYPQVDVVERASLNPEAVSPDYNLGAFIAFITALTLAFFTIWVLEFLMQSNKVEPNHFFFPFTPWFGQVEQPEAISEQTTDKSAIEQQDQEKLAHTPSPNSTLSNENLQLLLNKSDRNNRLLIMLLLSGLTVEEIAGLTLDQITEDCSGIELSGESARHITLGNEVKVLLQEVDKNGGLWHSQDQLSPAELNAMLYCLTIDTGLTDLDDTLGNTLRQTYIIFLITQGIRLTQLSQLIGYQSPLQLASYAGFSPSGSGYDIDQIQIIHPLCQ